jgi:AraC-like DNA-binding protein
LDQYPRQYLYRRVVKAKLFIDARFDSSIDLDRIASEACFSKYHFVRLFRSVYGRTPHQYLMDVRIARAKLLLADGDTVARACFAVGFDSISSFTALFRRRVNMTPAAYQRRSLAKRSAVAARPLKYIPGCFARKQGWITE